MAKIDNKGRFQSAEIEKALRGVSDSDKEKGVHKEKEVLYCSVLEIKDKIFLLLSVTNMNRNVIEEFIKEVVGKEDYKSCSFTFAGTKEAILNDARISLKAEDMQKGENLREIFLRSYEIFKDKNIFVYIVPENLFNPFIITKINFVVPGKLVYMNQISS